MSLDHLGEATGNSGARLLGDALDDATGHVLTNGKSPSRRVRELDNRGSHFYLAMYWARAMANQKLDANLAKKFASLADTLESNEETIVNELNAVQGERCEIGGYYMPDTDLAAKAMRPSKTFNDALAAFAA